MTDRYIQHIDMPEQVIDWIDKIVLDEIKWTWEKENIGCFISTSSYGPVVEIFGPELPESNSGSLCVNFDIYELFKELADTYDGLVSDLSRDQKAHLMNISCQMKRLGEQITDLALAAEQKAKGNY